MKRQLALLCMSSVLCCSTIFANPQHDPTIPIPQSANNAVDRGINGFYLGLGVAHNTLAVRYKSPIVFKNPPAMINLNIASFTSHLDTFSPSLILGWWSKPFSQFDDKYLRWGANIFYKYLGAQIPANSIPGGYDFTTRVDHELAALLSLDLQITKMLHTYLGAGVVIFPSVQGTIQSAPTTDALMLLNHVHSLFGGIVQIGVLCNFAQRWYANFSYSYAISGTQEFLSTGANGASFKRNLQVVNQQVTLSMNYIFKPI